MKNLKKWSFILIPLLFATIISCKGSLTEKGTVVGTDKKPLTISIAANDNIQLFKNEAGPSRVIYAPAFTTTTGDGGDNLHFYLWGTSSTGYTLAPKEISVIRDTDDYHGKVVLDIECYNWELALAACKEAPTTINEANILEKAVLIGYGNVDMMFTDSIKFTISPRGLTNPGYVNMPLKIEGETPLAGYKITANIYDIITGKPILATTGTDTSLAQVLQDPGASPAVANLSAPTATTGENSYYTVTYTAGVAAEDIGKKKPITPGTYSFVVEFEKGGKSFVTNETIIVLPGRTIETPVIILNPIGLLPARPTAFAVEFNKYKENESASSLTAEAEDKVVGKYLAHFSWTATNVNTEKNFRLQLAEVEGDDAVAAMADPADPTTDGAFTTVNTAFKTLWDASSKTFEFTSKEQLANEQMYKSGSLFHDSTWVDIYLDLGKRYIARLYSENDAGLSENPSYVAITPVETADPAVTMTTINRYRVKYWNKSGKWGIDSTKSNATVCANESTDEIIQYWSQSNTAYKVFNPNGADTLTSNPVSLTLGESTKWLNWSTDPISNLTADVYPAFGTGETASVYTPENYSGYKNLDLYANYSGDVEIWNDADYEIQQTWLKAFGLDGTVSKEAKNTFAKSGESTTIELKIPNDGSVPGNWKYDYVSLTIRYANKLIVNTSQTGEARGTANVFTIPLNKLSNGMYYCNISAQYKQTIVDYPFTVWITE
ncbi:MAG: hypothetical protein J5710_11800 [Treponema sp.]|nr:hypothetical protein [Treponema sp.]